MSRIRSIHPALTTDENYMALSIDCPQAGMFLFGLWMEADDAGAFEWKPLTLKAKALPVVLTSAEDMLAALVRHSFVREFVVAGRKYGVIRNFVRFQRPKEPKDIHPMTEEMLSYAGFTPEGKRPPATTGRKAFESAPEHIPNDFGSGSEVCSQMKEVGCRREEEGPILKDSELPPVSSETSSDIGENPSREILGKAVDPPKALKKLAKNGYPEEFVRFWSTYPTDGGMSKKQAFAEWSRLDESERSAAISAIPAFRSWVAKQGSDYRIVHAVRYLSQRRFEGFQAAAAAQTNQVFVEVGTRPWQAWSALRASHGKRDPPTTQHPETKRDGWFFETLWPPSSGNHAEHVE